ncbi:MULTISPECIES: ABC transporter permease [Cytobacillus]|nr:MULTISPECIES: ABC transporter permease [Cytobacillus]
MSIGLSILVSITETNKGTVQNTLEQNWKSSYHIVVRPEGVTSLPEDEGLLEPNFLSGITGGISLQQYQQIKAMEEVDVAAPIAILGYLPLSVKMDSFSSAKNEEGIYKFQYTETVENGYNKRIQAQHTKFLVSGPWYPNLSRRENPSETFGAFPWQNTSGEHVIISRNLLVGIDPVEEAKLVGLDKASTKYFESDDKPFVVDKTLNQLRIPLLLSSQPFTNTNYSFQLEKLNISLPDSKEEVQELMENIRDKGGESYLKTLESEKVTSSVYSSQDAYNSIFDRLLNKNEKSSRFVNTSTVLGEKIGPLTYKHNQSPFPERWQHAYKLEPKDTILPWAKDKTYAFREVQERFEETETTDRPNDFVRLDLNIIGAYDPSQLNIAKDPLTELPMETYRTARAKLVLDDTGKPVNPPVTLKATNNPLDFLLQPPTALTSLEAADKISAFTGGEPISAIRIKIKDVNSLTKGSQEKLERVAASISKQTGLKADITLGSSPQSVLTFIPENNSVPSLGWIEQPWVKLGSAFTILNETKLGYSGIIMTVLLVAVVYVFTTRLISYLTNRKHYALLLAFGWSLNQLKKLIILESVLLGLIASMTIWAVQIIIHFLFNTTFSFALFWLSGVAGFFIYFLGGILPAKMMELIKPYEAIKTGEISTNMKRFFYSNNILGVSFQYLFGKSRRTAISIISLAIPVTLLSYFIFITFRLKGVLYTSYLGEYIALEIGSIHYAATIIAIIMAILTTAEIMWQNIMERKPEISLLKAIGWQNQSVRKMVIYEGAFIGFFAGILSLVLSGLLILITYKTIDFQDSLFLFCLPILIPITAGSIGSLFPAEMAVRISPMEGTKK